MKQKRKTSAPIVVFIVGLTVGVARGQGTVVLHQGATDPVTEGFTYSGVPTSIGPVIGDLGVDAWSTKIGTNTITYYSQSLTPLQQAQAAGVDWIMSATLRVVQTADYTRGNSFARFYMGAELFPLDFGANSNGDPFVHFGNASATPLFTLVGAGSTYHNYQLRYHASTSTADLWVDGAERFTGIAGIPGFAWWGVTWGEGQLGNSQANWNRVSFEIIPEPSSLALLGCGGVLLTGHWLRRFRKAK
jgi:hypothetical protein